MDLADVKATVRLLFPEHPTEAWTVPAFEREEVPPVTDKEIEDMMRKIKVGKASGPDGMAAATWCTAVKTMGCMVAECYTECLKQRWFPTKWKVARLVLAHKGGNHGATRRHIAPYACWTMQLNCSRGLSRTG